MCDPDSDVIFAICGAMRDSPIVCEEVPGSVAKRYRNIQFVSGSALVTHFNTTWFITFGSDASTSGVVLTVSNGSEIPQQEKAVVSTTSTSRGTLIVTPATVPVLTGGYVVSFLQSNQNAHDIWISTRGFELQRLISELANLKTRRPDLFRRSTDRYQSRAKKLKKSGP